MVSKNPPDKDSGVSLFFLPMAHALVVVQSPEKPRRNSTQREWLLTVDAVHVYRRGSRDRAVQQAVTTFCRSKLSAPGNFPRCKKLFERFSRQRQPNLVSAAWSNTFSMAKDRPARHEAPTDESISPQSTKKAHKRKRDLDGSAVDTSTPTKKSKRDKKSSSKSDKKRSEPAIDDSVQEDAAAKESAVSEEGSKEISPNASDSKDKTEKKSKSSKRRASKGNNDGDEGAEDISEGKDGAQNEGEDDTPNASKHKFSGLLSKFQRSAKVQEVLKTKGDRTAEAKPTEVTTAEPVKAQGLEPLPQPEAAPEEQEQPTYSSLPSWLANPVRASADDRTKFSDLGINADLLRILEAQGYKEAFAVQSTVIPLLLSGAKGHSGDLCISAATGSGKTLSYVLPLVTALEHIPAPRLRGLIVVPTRELVKQAREACELCTAGSGLQIGSAVGNVAIKDEQHLLMRTDQVYGPETFKSRQGVKFTGEDWTNFNLQDYISEAADLNESLPGYLHRPEPNVDILICTPGRLVDHLRYTKGFTLKHLEWLVIDEADRLLNESFQEWVDVVMNSLDARKAQESFGFSGKVMSELGLPIEVKEPKKVVLSATMTRDVSKLNLLRLANPKMVVVGSTDHVAAGEDEDGIPPYAEDQFNLPSTLKEYSISVGDGAQKPLYLLRLLLSHIGLGSQTNRTRALPDAADDTSSAGSDSDETSSDESSDESSSDDSSSDDSESDSSEEDTSSSESESDSDSESSADSGEDESTENTSKPEPSRTTVLVFTKSSESASRLSRLIALLDPSLASRVGTIIKSNKSSASRKTLTAFRRGKISVIVATDRASRGLDLPSLTHVVNYDVPSSITTYVHRVGRTARAGKEGSAWTLFAHREGRWFTNEIARGSDGKITRSAKVQRVNMKLDDMADAKSRYGAALEALEQEVRTGGKVKSSTPKA